MINENLAITNLKNFTFENFKYVVLMLYIIGISLIIALILKYLANKTYFSKVKITAKSEQTTSEIYKNIVANSTGNVRIVDWGNINIEYIAKTADFIVNGYAFTSDNNQIRVLNLNNTDKATVLDKNGEVLMTSMDDIEISIVQKYFERNKEFIEQDEEMN